MILMFTSQYVQSNFLFLAKTKAMDISDQSLFNQFISAVMKFVETVYRLIFVNCKAVQLCMKNQ